MTSWKHIKIAKTQNQIADFISHRWSPLAFADIPIHQSVLETLFEAASWSYSANNAQPWDYYYAHRSEEPGFSKLLSCLVPVNQLWAKNAAVLIAAVARKKMENGTLNSFAKHDLGAANSVLSSQAVTMNVYTHLMGGFDTQKTLVELDLDAEEKEPVVFMALGYLGEAEQLEEPFLSRELSPRFRRPLSETIHQL